MYLTIKAYSKQSYFQFYNKIGGIKKDFNKEILFDKIIYQNVKINFYNNLTILFNFEDHLGQSLEEEIEILIDKNIYVGSDEVGVGEKIGPLIVCAAKFLNFKNKKDAILETGGIKDSKKLDAQKISIISEKIKKYLNYKCIVLEPNKYNQLLKEGKNTKEINALTHHKLQEYFVSKRKQEIFVIDQFVNKRKYFEYLKRNDQKHINTEIVFVEKGEEKYLEIACAAIIAKSKYNAWVYEYFKNRNLSFLIKGKKINTIDIAKKIEMNRKDFENLFKEWN